MECFSRGIHILRSKGFTVFLSTSATKNPFAPSFIWLFNLLFFRRFWQVRDTYFIRVCGRGEWLQSNREMKRLNNGQTTNQPDENPNPTNIITISDEMKMKLWRELKSLIRPCQCRLQLTGASFPIARAASHDAATAALQHFHTRIQSLCNLSKLGGAGMTPRNVIIMIGEKQTSLIIFLLPSRRALDFYLQTFLTNWSLPLGCKICGDLRRWCPEAIYRDTVSFGRKGIIWCGGKGEPLTKLYPPAFFSPFQYRQTQS